MCYRVECGGVLLCCLVSYSWLCTYVGVNAVYVFSLSAVMSPRRIRCNRLGGADGVIPRAGGASRALTERSSSEGRDHRGSGGRDRATPSRTPESGNMQAVLEELRAGSRIPVTVDQIVNDTLLVTLTYRERSYTGILLDCQKKWVEFLSVFERKLNHFSRGPKQQAEKRQTEARVGNNENKPKHHLSHTVNAFNGIDHGILFRIAWF